MRFRPGEVLGTRQSGLQTSPWRLVEDQEVWRGRQLRRSLLGMNLWSWPLLQAELKYRYERLMGGAILT